MTLWVVLSAPPAPPGLEPPLSILLTPNYNSIGKVRNVRKQEMAKLFCLLPIQGHCNFIKQGKQHYFWAHLRGRMSSPNAISLNSIQN